jgi:hypothetical protein
MAVTSMCKMTECTKQQGMCGHEKMMLAVLVMLLAGGEAYWLLA